MKPTTITEALLSELNHSDSKIKYSAVVSKDGWTYAHSEQQSLDDDEVSGMSAAVFTVAKQSIATLAGGNLKKILIEGEHSQILITWLTNDVFLTTITQIDADIRAVFKQMSSFKNDYDCIYC